MLKFYDEVMNVLVNFFHSLVQGSSVIDPKVNLIHGLILYQLWYSSLPGEMQIKGFNNQMAFDTHNMPSNGCDETEIFESSNDHYAIYNKNSNTSSRFASESSVGNGKVFPGCWSDAKKKPFQDASPTPLFYMERSEENSVPGVPDTVHRFLNKSIFFAHGKFLNDHFPAPSYISLILMINYFIFGNHKFMESELWNVFKM